MTTISAVVTIHIPWAASLKDKRQVRRSLIDKVRARYNVAAAEVDTQERHQLLTLGIAAVSAQPHHAREIIDDAVRFIEGGTEAEVTGVEIRE